MTAIVYRSFAGEQPRYEAHLLPPTAAQLAMNCDFESGALSPTAGGVFLNTLASNPVRGLFSTDGINCFSWPVEAQAIETPIIEDIYNRMYFLLPSEGVIRAGLTAEMSALGPTPLTTFAVGVPQPTVAPVLTLVDRTTLPEYAGATVTAEAWWELSGSQYGSAAVILTAVAPFKSYTFAPPAKPTGTPDGAVLSGKIQIKDSAGVVLVSVSTRAGASGRSNSLPGGVEISLYSGAVATFSMLWGVTETRAYTYVNENTWGEAGAPAPAGVIAPTYLQDVRVVLAASVFTGYRPFSKFKIYRTYGSTAAYIETLCTGTGLTFMDASRSPSTVGAVLASADWFPPPTGVSGFGCAVNGWLYAYKGNDLHMSDPYQAHAWPYVQKFPHAIRGVQPTQQALVVTTAKGVYLLSGANPIGSGQIRLPLPQPGVAQRSMAEIDGAIAYASSDGFALVAGSDASMVASQRLFTRKTWRAQYNDILTDKSMRFAYHDGRLIATSHTQAKGFALRLDEDVGSYTRLNVRADCTFYLPVNDALYYTVDNGLYQFQAGAAQSFDWWGKDFTYPAPVAYGVGFLRADGPVTLRLYADGVQVFTQLLSPGYFTLPDINAAQRWSVRMSGSVKVYELLLALTFEDLKRA